MDVRYSFLLVISSSAGISSSFPNSFQYLPKLRTTSVTPPAPRTVNRELTTPEGTRLLLGASAGRRCGRDKEKETLEERDENHPTKEKDLTLS